MSSRVRDDAGSALVEFSWVGIILFVPLMWIVLSVYQVQQGAFALNGAARAATRAYALAPDDATGEARAKAIVEQALTDQGPDGMTAEVRFDCTTKPNCHSGTSLITITLDSGVALPYLPDFLAPENRSFDLDASHTVPIGQFVEITDGSPEESS